MQVQAYASTLHVNTQLVVNRQIAYFTYLLTAKHMTFQFNETQPLKCQLSKSVALPTIITI